jgi:hypothetical protein
MQHSCFTLNALCVPCSTKFFQFHGRPAACVLPLWQWRHTWCSHFSRHLPGDVACAEKVWHAHMAHLLPIPIAPVST